MVDTHQAPPQQQKTSRSIRGATSGTVSVDDTETTGNNKTTTGIRGSRSRNFVPWEDEALSNSYVNTSRDPVAGAYQKGPAYWEHIHGKWCVLHAAAPLSLKVYSEVRTVDQLYCRWKKHINKDMGVFMKYLGQVYSDMPTGTPEKEYIRVAAKRYKEALGKVFRFENCVPTLVQLARFSLNRFKRNRTTCLAVRTGINPGGAMMSEDDQEEDDGVVCYGEEEHESQDDFLERGGGVPVTQQPTNNSSRVDTTPSSTGRFLTASTYGPPPGKTTGTKKAKALMAAARKTKKNVPAPPPSQVSVAAEIVAKSVSEIKSEIAKLAGTTQDQLKLDEEKLKLEEVKLKLEEVNTYIRLGMREEAAASMAAFSAVKKRLEECRTAAAQQEDKEEQQDGPSDSEHVSHLPTSPSTNIPSCEECTNKNRETDGSVNLLVDEPNDNNKEGTYLDEEDSSSESTLSSFRFRRRKKQENGNRNNQVTNNGQTLPPPPVPESVVVDSGSDVLVGVPTTIQQVEPTPSQLTTEWRLKRKKRRLEQRATARANQPTPLLDRTNQYPPDEVEVEWQQQKTLGSSTQLTLPDDLQSTHSGSVIYRGDTQRETMF
jgi:hypothetical protein